MAREPALWFQGSWGEVLTSGRAWTSSSGIVWIVRIVIIYLCCFFWVLNKWGRGYFLLCNKRETKWLNNQVFGGFLFCSLFLVLRLAFPGWATWAVALVLLVVALMASIQLGAGLLSLPRSHLPHSLVSGLIFSMGPCQDCWPHIVAKGFQECKSRSHQTFLRHRLGTSLVLFLPHSVGWSRSQVQPRFKGKGLDKYVNPGNRASGKLFWRLRLELPGTFSSWSLGHSDGKLSLKCKW